MKTFNLSTLYHPSIGTGIGSNIFTYRPAHRSGYIPNEKLDQKYFATCCKILLFTYSSPVTMEICKYPQWSSKHYIFFILDAIYNAIIITPICVSLWWSVWDLILEISLLMNTTSYPHMGLWILLVCGSIGKISMYLSQPCFQPYMESESRSKLCIWIVLRIDMYVMFVFGMAVWVSLWTLLDELTGINWQSTLACLVIGLSGLIVLRSLNNGVSAPMNLSLDSNEKPFNYPMRFKSEQNYQQSRFRQCVCYFFNCFLTVTTIDYSLVCYWRAGFNILDLYILPNNPALSA